MNIGREWEKESKSMMCVCRVPCRRTADNTSHHYHHRHHQHNLLTSLSTAALCVHTESVTYHPIRRVSSFSAFSPLSSARSACPLSHRLCLSGGLLQMPTIGICRLCWATTCWHMRMSIDQISRLQVGSVAREIGLVRVNRIIKFIAPLTAITERS